MWCLEYLAHEDVNYFSVCFKNFCSVASSTYHGEKLGTPDQVLVAEM